MNFPIEIFWCVCEKTNHKERLIIEIFLNIFTYIIPICFKLYKVKVLGKTLKLFIPCEMILGDGRRGKEVWGVKMKLKV